MAQSSTEQVHKLDEDESAYMWRYGEWRWSPAGSRGHPKSSGDQRTGKRGQTTYLRSGFWGLVRPVIWYTIGWRWLNHLLTSKTQSQRLWVSVRLVRDSITFKPLSSHFFSSFFPMQLWRLFLREYWKQNRPMAFFCLSQSIISWRSLGLFTNYLK